MARMNTHVKKKSGTILAGSLITLLGCTLWGFSGTSVQYLISEAHATASLVTVMRMTVGGLLFLGCIALFKRDTLRSMFSSREALLKMALFSFALYANQICYSYTVQATNAGTATVFETSGAAFVMLYICMRGHTAPRARELFGLTLALLSTVLIATQGDIRTLSMPLDALIWALLTGITAAFYIVVPKECGLFDRFGSFSVTGIGMLFGIVFSVAGYFLEGSTLASAETILAGFTNFDWGLFLVGAVIAGTMGGYGFYLKGVSMVGPVKGSLLSAAEPVSATLFATFWLGTVFSGWDLAGLVLMCVMIAFVTSDTNNGGNLDER